MKPRPIPLTSERKLLLRAIIVLHGNRCRYCGGEADGTDHVIPRSKGGSDEPRNLVAVCRQCNSSKGDNRLAPDLEETVLAEAFILEPSAYDLAEMMRYGEQKAQERRRNLRPWMVA